MAFDFDALMDRRRLKRRLTFWRVLAVSALALIVILFFNSGNLTLNPYVARLNVDGVILEDRDTERLLRQVAEDGNAKALIVRINSPGGTTAGSEALYQALRRVAENKPVVAVMGTLAASGGYVTAIAADRIFARETTLTGSIGVIVEYAQVGELFDKLGIQMETVKSAPLKGEPSLTEPLSAEGRAALQALIDDGYAWFVGLVAERRGLPYEQVLTLADGRVFSGRQAIENRLIDAIGGERDARLWLEAEHDISADLGVVDIEPSASDRLIRQLVGGHWRDLLLPDSLALDGLVSLWHPNN